MDRQAVGVVLDEPELPELVQKKVHARPRGADHLRERLLRDGRQHALRLITVAVARQQQQGTGKALLTRVEQLIDQVRLQSGVPAQHVGDEAIRERVVRMQQGVHLLLRYHVHGGRGRGRRCFQPHGVTRQCPFAEEIPRAQRGDDGLLAGM